MSETANPPVDTLPPTGNSRLGAEALGTFWLVLGGCGTAMFGGDHVAIALAFGLTVLTGAYALGHISGAHFNPAVTVGLATAKRFAWADVPGYVIAQVVGATGAGAVLLLIANGRDDFQSDGGMATNGFGDHSPRLRPLVGDHRRDRLHRDVPLRDPRCHLEAGHARCRRRHALARPYISRTSASPVTTSSNSGLSMPTMAAAMSSRTW